MFLPRINHGDAADLGRLQSFLGEDHGIFVVLDDVDLFPAQLADDGLHAHALHAHTGADGVYIFVLGHDRDLGAFAGFTGDGADLYRAVVDLGNLGLKQVLYQLRRGARHDDRWALGVLIDAGQHDAHALANGERLQPRLFLLGHLGFGFADVKDHIRPFNALHRGVDALADASDVLVVDCVPFSFTNFLENDLLGDLRGDASQPLGGLAKAYLAADLGVGVNHLVFFLSNLSLRIIYFIF